jgi:ubiquinol-cytochrome c reductase cytochrome b subunit
MILLVPLSFGFTYMMIKMAKHAEANAKLQPKKPPKGSINISQKWLYILFVSLLAFQVYLNISAYYAVLQGMKNYSLFIIGIMMLVFAAMFHVYRYGRGRMKAPPPKPVSPAPAKPTPAPAPPKPAPAATTSGVQKPMAAPPTVTARVSSEQVAQLEQPQQPQQKHAAASGGASAANVQTEQTLDHAHLTSAASKETEDKKLSNK